MAIIQSRQNGRAWGSNIISRNHLLKELKSAAAETSPLVHIARRAFSERNVCPCSVRSQIGSNSKWHLAWSPRRNRQQSQLCPREDAQTPGHRGALQQGPPRGAHSRHQDNSHHPDHTIWRYHIILILKVSFSTEKKRYGLTDLYYSQLLTGDRDKQQVSSKENADSVYCIITSIAFTPATR